MKARAARSGVAPRGGATCVAVAGAVALAVGACGDSKAVDARLQRTLPTVQGALLGHLCDPLDASTGQPISTRRRAQREMVVLLRTLRASPEANVRTLRMTDNGDVREELTIRELAESHVSGLSEIVQTSDGRVERCARKAAAELRMAIEQSG